MDGPLPTGSRPASSAHAARLGAPVTDPPGSRADSTCMVETSSRSRAATVEAACHRPDQSVRS